MNRQYDHLVIFKTICLLLISSKDLQGRVIRAFHAASNQAKIYYVAWEIKE